MKKSFSILDLPIPRTTYIKFFKGANMNCKTCGENVHVLYDSLCLVCLDDEKERTCKECGEVELCECENVRSI